MYLCLDSPNVTLVLCRLELTVMRVLASKLRQRDETTRRNSSLPRRLSPSSRFPTRAILDDSPREYPSYLLENIENKNIFILIYFLLRSS